ncbi:MAG: hypothetical protein QOF49_1382, partial [Chloroflexota bacterium]|nr:hypothetical protein [Chloroflexota bacterium]
LRAADRDAAAILRTSEARLRLLVDHLPALAWTTDRDLLLTSMTGDGLARLGIDAAALTGRNLLTVLDDPDQTEVDRVAIMQAHDEALQGRAASYRASVRGRTLQVHVEQLHVAGRTIGVIGVGLDLTDRLELEERLERSTRLESIGRLAGGVAHDFNNLLTAISGYADLLAESLPAGDQRHDVEEIQRAAQRAATLTGQLLTFGRRTDLRPELVAPNEIVGQMRDMLGRLLGGAIRLDVQLDPSVPPVFADPGQLEQVILNLAVNGGQAMPDGGTLTIETTSTTMADGAGGLTGGQVGAVAIRVRDTGHGMDAATQARIFEPFFTTKSRGKGTGLGLSTVYGIVVATGGTIEVVSAPDRGSTFTVLLPAANQAMADAAASPASVAVTASGSAATTTVARRPGATPGRSPGRSAERAETAPVILVAEDETAVRELVVHVLTTAGYTVVAASDGGEAIRVAGKQPCIDGVVSDVIMPHVSGPQLVAALRATRPGLPVLYMSGYTGDALDERAVVDDDVDLLAKPFSASDLLARVEAMLGTRTNEAAAVPV